MTSIKTVDVKTLKQWLDAKEALLIDVREPDEYQAGSIPGALLQPLAGVCLANLPELDKRKLVLHCKSGKRSEVACARLISASPNLEVYNLDGGITSWMEAGYPVHHCH